MGNLLSALGETRLLMKLNLLTLAVGVPIGFLLIPKMGIIGLLVSSLIAGVPSMVVGLYFSWKRYGAQVDLKASLRIFLASGTAALITYLVLSILGTADWVRLVSGSLLFLALYLFLAPLVNAINQSDVTNLRTIFSGTGLLSKLFEIPLRIMEKLSQVRTKITNTKVQ